MEINANTKMTDSLERRLIQQEANAMRDVEFARLGSNLARGVARLARRAADAIALLRKQAHAAKVDYVTE